MILGTLITLGLGYASINNKTSRFVLAWWLALNTALYLLGGPAID